MKLKKIIGLLFSFLLVFVLSSCTKSEKAEIAETEDIYISAAASLTDVINELKEIYEKDNKSVEIKTNFAGSGALQSQIEEGAPADIFISAADKQMNLLEEKKLIDEDSRVELLKNEVVLIVRTDEKVEDIDFKNLSAVDKIAIGDPSFVPVGQYSEEIFTNLGNWEEVKNKMVISQDVRQSLDWVVSGNIQSATVYKTDAITEKDKVKIIAQAPEKSHKEINYPLAIVEKNKDKKKVKDFYDFLKSDEAKKVYEKYGFVVNK